MAGPTLVTKAAQSHSKSGSQDNLVRGHQVEESALQRKMPIKTNVISSRPEEGRGVGSADPLTVGSLVAPWNLPPMGEGQRKW